MLILIPTFGRVEKQVTYDSLYPSVRRVCHLVVAPTEVKSHQARGRSIIECPVQGQGMAAVRSWIMEWCVSRKIPKVLMMDDDLKIQKWGANLKGHGESTEEEQKEMVAWVESALDTHLHCAFTRRNEAWNDFNLTRESTKGIQVVGYNVRRVMRETKCRFNRGVPPWFFMEDYHMTLQLLRAGFPNLVHRRYRVNFGAANVAGGCSKFRNQKSMEDASKLLEKLHPGFVKATKKTTKGSYGGGERWDVSVQWRKAANSFTKNPSRG